MKSAPISGCIIGCLVLAVACLVFGGCASNLPFSNRIDPGVGGTPQAMKGIMEARGREYDFSFDTTTEKGQLCITAYNRREAPVSVSIDLTNRDNVDTNRSFPFEEVVPPHSAVCLARVSRLHPDRDFDFNYATSWMVGDFQARHNPGRGYRLPWRTGERHQVIQAPGGPITTHTDRSSQYAVDFAMPVGTPILAARSGIVVNLEDSFSMGALDKVLADKANFVEILHDDGTIATYAHLAEHGVTVSLGQRVSEGEELGRSGSTGYSSGPHLHFAVWQPGKEGKVFVRVSLPVEFCTGDGSPCAPVTYGTVVPGSRGTGAGN